MKKKASRKKKPSVPKGLFDEVDFDEVFGAEDTTSPDTALFSTDAEDNPDNLPGIFDKRKPINTSKLVLYEPKDVVRGNSTEEHIDEDLHLLNGSLKQIHALWPEVRTLDEALRMIHAQTRLVEQRRKAANKQWGATYGRNGPDIVMPPIE